MKNRVLHLYSFVTIVIFLFIAFGSDGDNNYSSSSTGSKEVMAYVYAKDFVKQRLKAPSTAKFPNAVEIPNHVTYLGNDEYSINSWVESQNSFGAMIRNDFSCKIIFNGNEVSVKNLVIR